MNIFRTGLVGPYGCTKMSMAFKVSSRNAQRPKDRNTHKSIVGMVYSSPNSAYSRLLDGFLEKKQRMGIDTWGTDEKYVKDIYEPIEKLIKDNVAEKHQRLYPPHWGIKKRVAELGRHILVAEYLVDEWAELFQGKSMAELDELAASFSFENCVQREELNNILRGYSHV